MHNEKYRMAFTVVSPHNFIYFSSLYSFSSQKRARGDVLSGMQLLNEKNGGE
jgi:hypothetical protein